MYHSCLTTKQMIPSYNSNRVDVKSDIRLLPTFATVINVSELKSVSFNPAWLRFTSYLRSLYTQSGIYPHCVKLGFSSWEFQIPAFHPTPFRWGEEKRFTLYIWWTVSRPLFVLQIQQEKQHSKTLVSLVKRSYQDAIKMHYLLKGLQELEFLPWVLFRGISTENLFTGRLGFPFTCWLNCIA